MPREQVLGLNPGRETLSRPATRSVVRIPDDSPGRRTGKASDLVAAILNSLFAQGYLSQTGANPLTFEVRDAVYEVGRPPDVQDDSRYGVLPGAKWIDTHANRIYFCVDNTEGAAVWRGPY